MGGVVTIASTSIEAMSREELDDATRRLPALEQQRAGTIGLDRPRKAFVVGRLLLRSTVARIVDVRPEDVGIRLEPNGRPVLTGVVADYFVSIAHSGPHVVVGVAKSQTGVDVERLRQVAPSPRLMARVCSPDELRLLENMTAHERAAAFTALWTRKEAYGKALGRGLDFALLRSVTVSESTISGAGQWQLADIDVDPACASAVVVQGSDWQVQLDRVDRRSL